MKRRDAIKNSAFLSGCGLSAGTIAAFISGCSTASLPAGNFFSGADLKLLGLVVDTFLPKTDTASATEAGVHTYLDENIASSMKKKEQDQFLVGLKLVEEQSKKDFNKLFESLSVVDREKVLLSLNNTDGKPNYFKVLQGPTLYTYYTSELGATQALEYLPIPGEYIACMPVSDVGKAWAL
ncbi:MAG: hypothetical protein ACJA01_003835 [Saprospiraceae bacterium]|jgi:hypothetical protein